MEQHTINYHLNITQEALKAALLYGIFQESIEEYHQKDHINTPLQNPYTTHTLEALLYEKNWIDTIQWHLEDIIRRDDIAPEAFIATKRRIDASNQTRTDLVEQIDDWFVAYFEVNKVIKQANAPINSESIAWLIDRMSILMLKIYHMKEQTERSDAAEAHIQKCQNKLALLQEQQQDLALAFDTLLKDILEGKRYAKVYRQVKMYNDESLNPQLYQNKKA